MNTLKNINERIRYVYSKSGLNQTKFAKKLKITDSYASRILKGKLDDRIPSDRLLYLIEKEFGYFFTWLKTGEGEMFEHKPEIMAETISPYGPSPILDEILKRVKIIYEEGNFEAKAKIIGIINVVYDEIFRLKKMDVIKYDAIKKEKEAPSAAEGEDVRDKAG